MLRDDVVLRCTAHETDEEYSIWLLHAAEGMLRAEAMEWKEIEVYAVVTGPGSFTGLRVGLTTAKGLSQVYGKRIAAVPRLEAVASMAPKGAEWVAVAVEAGRGEIYGGLYRRESNELKLEGEECVSSGEEFLSRVANRVPGGGVSWRTPGTERIRCLEGWSQRAAAGDRLDSAVLPLAPAVGKTAYKQARAGRLVDALHLDANYIRRPDAERFWKGAEASRDGK